MAEQRQWHEWKKDWRSEVRHGLCNKSPEGKDKKFVLVVGQPLLAI